MTNTLKLLLHLAWQLSLELMYLHRQGLHRQMLRQLFQLTLQTQSGSQAQVQCHPII